MTEDLENKLIKIDPVFFQERIACIEGKMNEMNTCMYWGCECGDGWFEPLKEMTTKISFLNESGKKDNVQIICEQLKEKYGTLRVYYKVSPINFQKETINQNIYNDLAEDIINDTERKCMSYCESCGKKGNKDNPIVETSGWISYICFDCAFNAFLKENERKAREPQIGLFYDAFSFLSMAHKYRYYHINRYYESVAEGFYSLLKPDMAKVFGIVSNNPYSIFELANKFVFNEEKYSPIAVELMRDILKSKFDKKDGIGNLLKKTGDIPIVFGNTFHENFWGSCCCEKCKDKEHQNIYGNLLMKIRKNL